MACPNTLSHCPSQKTWSASMRPTCSPQFSGSSCSWYYSLARSVETLETAGAFKGFKVIVGSGSVLTWVQVVSRVLSVWPSHYLYMTLLREFMLWSVVQRNLCPMKSDWDLLCKHQDVCQTKIDKDLNHRHHFDLSRRNTWILAPVHAPQSSWERAGKWDDDYSSLHFYSTVER